MTLCCTEENRKMLYKGKISAMSKHSNQSEDMSINVAMGCFHSSVTLIATFGRQPQKWLLIAHCIVFSFYRVLWFVCFSAYLFYIINDSGVCFMYSAFSWICVNYFLENLILLAYLSENYLFILNSHENI